MKWQYKWIVLPAFAADRENMLSEMGLNCWELVGFDQGLAYFKRPKPEEVQPPPAEAIASSLGVPTKIVLEDFSKTSYANQSQRSKKK